MLDTTLVCGRRFEIVGRGEGGRWPPEDPCFTARVRWLQADEEPSPAAVEVGGRLAGLVEEWVGLVKEGRREREERQIDAILKDLGPMTEMDTPDGEARACI